MSRLSALVIGLRATPGHSAYAYEHRLLNAQQLAMLPPMMRKCSEAGQFLLVPMHQRPSSHTMTPLLRAGSSRRVLSV